MSYTYEMTVWCDRCAMWEQYPVQGVRDLRAQAKKNGWIYRWKEDLCPDCAKEDEDPDGHAGQGRPSRFLPVDLSEE